MYITLDENHYKAVNNSLTFKYLKTFYEERIIIHKIRSEQTPPKLIFPSVQGDKVKNAMTMYSLQGFLVFHVAFVSVPSTSTHEKNKKFTKYSVSPFHTWVDFSKITCHARYSRKHENVSIATKFQIIEIIKTLFKKKMCFFFVHAGDLPLRHVLIFNCTESVENFESCNEKCKWWKSYQSNHKVQVVYLWQCNYMHTWFSCKRLSSNNTMSMKLE